MKFFKSFIVGFIIFGLSSCGQDYEFDGLYIDDNFIISDQSVRFCTVHKGNISFLSLARMAKRNTAVEVDLKSIKQASLKTLQEIKLKYNLKGELRLSIGTTIENWKKLDYKPFERPCINSDSVINFIYHVKSPYTKKSKDGLHTLNTSSKSFARINKIFNSFQKENIKTYGLLWEAVSGRKVDKGWVFEIIK